MNTFPLTKAVQNFLLSIKLFSNNMELVKGNSNVSRDGRSEKFFNKIPSDVINKCSNGFGEEENLRPF
jgi:hypothetical protein